jgi:hypothetical protein
MDDESWKNNVTNPDYSFVSAKNFFGGTDSIRIVIIIYILISFVLNCLNFTVFFITMKKANRETPLAICILISVLLVNFLHTFTYFFEWVIKEGVNTIKIMIDETEVEVGGLLAGNPRKMSACKGQGFLLIASSISQDFLINIFFYIASSSIKIKEKLIKILAVSLGFGFPFFFTLILALTGALGINDRFCYVNKFEFTIEEEGNLSYVKYREYDYFQVVVIVVYLVRVVNFFATCYFLKKIISNIRERGESKLYLFKSIFIPIIQLFTIWIGVIYRVINIFSPSASVSLAVPYLILNTVDGVLFPVGFFLQNNIWEYFKRLFSKQPQPEEKENLIEFTDKAKEDEY